MTDQSHEPTLDTADDVPSQLRGTVFAGATPTANPALSSVAAIMKVARLVERYTEICIDGVLLADFENARLELRRLVADDGTVLPDENGDEPTLAQVSRAEELNELIPELRRKMQEATAGFRFRALPSEKYEAFLESHRDGQGRIKNQQRLENQLIAKCCISHDDLDADAVEELRTVFNQAQMVDLWNNAYAVNNNDGISVPKLPSFLVQPRR